MTGVSENPSNSAQRLLPLVYDELRRLAASKLARMVPGQTLQATALVHEAFLRLVAPDHQQSWQSRRHFYASAAMAMRHILIDRARRKLRLKHGGQAKHLELQQADITTNAPSENLLALDEALTKLEVHAPQKAQLIKLRYFAGLTIEESAEMLRISRTTAHRHWTYARAWLLQEMTLSDDSVAE